MVMLNRFPGNFRNAICACICTIGPFLSAAYAQTAASNEKKNVVFIPIDDDLVIPILVPSNPPDPARVAAMRNFDAQGNAILDRLPGDTMQSLARAAYGSAEKWWVIAEANKVMSDRELSTLSQVIIPNIENTSWNPHVLQAHDDGVSFHYFNTITGDVWQEYYIPAVSQIDPPVYEDNPNWLQGLAFVNGGDRTSWRPDGFYISRSYPYPVVSGAELLTISNAPPEMDEIEFTFDSQVIDDLPTANNVDLPPPPIKAAPGSDPNVVVNMYKKYPEEVLNTVRVHGVRVVTVKESVLEIAPEVATIELQNWGKKLTWQDVPGMYYSTPYQKIVVIATKSTKHGSISLADHEFMHAYNEAMGRLSDMPEFEAAFNSDWAALEKADGSGNGYYTKTDKYVGQSVPTFTRARGEAFAEGMSRYFNGDARWFADKPALLRYFQSWSRPQPTGR